MRVRTLTIDNLRRGLPVAWVGADHTYVGVDLFVGHPGRVTDEAVMPNLCDIGNDLFVAWYDRPSESQSCWQYADVEVITEDEYAERVRRVASGRRPT